MNTSIIKIILYTYIHYISIMNKYFIIIIVAICALLTSCNQQKNIVYLQDTNAFEQMQIAQSAVVKARKGDVLIISVSSRNAESAIPFNLMASGRRPGAGSTDNLTSLTQRVLSYNINSNGDIEFPQLGIVHVDGLTREQIGDYIKDKLIQNGFLKDPIVTVEFQGLQISVLGEVARPGKYTMNNDRTNLLEALAMAGDLTVYGLRDRVAVIREVDGQRTVIWHDLRSKDIFSSPCYNLQQNDIVYVEPNKYKADQSTQSRWNQPGVWISIFSSVLSLATLIISLSK